MAVSLRFVIHAVKISVAEAYGVPSAECASASTVAFNSCISRTSILKYAQCATQNSNKTVVFSRKRITVTLQCPSLDIR